MKTSFRKFVVNTIRENSTWSEMAVGTRLDTKAGGLPTNQGLCNVVSICANKSSDRALLFKWLLNEGLYKAVQFRNGLTEWLIEKLDHDVPIQTREIPKTSFSPMRKAVGESTQYKEALKSSEEPGPPRIHQYQNQIINPLDIFSSIMRKKIPELGQHAEEVDAKWKSDFEDKLDIPIFKDGQPKGSVRLSDLNAILESKGYEGFYYGPHRTKDGKWSGGYLQSVEKGDWIPEGQKAHWSDKGQRHGPDLSQAKMAEDDKGNAFYVFDNMSTPQDEYALRRKAEVMKQKFVDLVNNVGQGSDISDMHKQIAHSVKQGDFKKDEWPPSATNYAKDKFGVDARTAQSEAIYPTEVVKDLIKLVKAGLNGPFKVANLEDKLVGIPPEIVSDMIASHEGNNFYMSDKFKKMAFDFIFQHVDLQDLDSQEEWPLMPKNKWKSFFDKSQFGKEKEWTKPWTDLFFTLAVTVSNGAQSNPELMTPAVNYIIKHGMLPIDDIAKKNEPEYRELTPKGLSQLVNMGYKINGKIIPDDLDEIKSMIDSHGHEKIMAKKGDHLVNLTKQKDGKYYAVFQSPGDKKFGDLGNPKGHMLSGLQMPVSMGQGRMGMYPTETSEDQNNFEEDLMSGKYGEGEPVGNITELSSLKNAVNAAINQYKQGHQRGVTTNKQGNKIKGRGTPEDIENLFHGHQGLMTVAAEALKALGGHYAMKYGFITDEQYNQNTKFSPNDELNKIDGGRTFTAIFEDSLSKVGIVIPEEGVIHQIVDKVWKTIQKGDGPQPKDFENYIQKFGPKLWDALKHSLKINAKAGRSRLIKNYVLSWMDKTKQSIVNQSGVQSMNLVDDGETGGHDILGSGKSYKSVDPFAGKAMTLDDERFHQLKKWGMSIYGKEPLPETLDELKTLINAKDVVPVKAVIKMDAEHLRNYLSSEKDIEHLSNLKGIKIKLYLYKGLKEKENISHIDLEKTEEAYLMSSKRPDDIGTGEDQKQIQIGTGFAKPDDFGQRVKDFKAGKTANSGTVTSGPPVEPVTATPATPASSEPVAATSNEPAFVPGKTLPYNKPVFVPGKTLPVPGRKLESTLPDYKVWKETSAIYDPKVKVKDGCGFNWWGSVGNSGGTSIGGEVETKKGIKSAKRRKK